MTEDFSPDAAEFRCLVPFPDGSDSFVHGFEAGMIWQRMTAGEQVIGGVDEVATHSANAAVFQRMADAQGYDLAIDDNADGWMIATFTRRQHRLRLVSSSRAKGSSADQGVRRRVRQSGVMVDAHRYGASFLHDGTDVLVRLDPDRAGQAQIYSADQGEYLGVAICPELTRGV